MGSINLFEPVIYDESIENVKEVLKSGWIGLGPKTAEFERKFAEYTGAKYCVGLNSATSALHLAMKLIDLKEGDEVITTSLTFVSSNHAILYEKGTPVFADVDPKTLNIDPQDILRKITKKTKAILCVHFGGYPCDMEEIHKIASDHNIVVIEDCAHAAGSSYKGKMIGSISSINCFSFHAVKNLPMGDGGAITTNNKFYDERLRKLRWLGINKDTFNRTSGDKKINVRAYAWKYAVDELGYKCHLNDISAAIGLGQLEYLDRDNIRRRQIFNMYKDGLSNVKDLRFLDYKTDRITSQHLVVAIVERRDDLINHLKNHSINPGVHYLRNDGFSMYERAELPNVEYMQERLISLPIHMNLTDEDVQTVIETIKKGW